MLSSKEQIHQLTSLTIDQLIADVETIIQARQDINEFVFSRKIPIAEYSTTNLISYDMLFARKTNPEKWTIEQMLEVITIIANYQDYSLDQTEQQRFDKIRQSLTFILYLTNNFATYIDIHSCSYTAIIEGTILTKDKYYYRVNNPSRWSMNELIEVLQFISSSNALR